MTALLIKYLEELEGWARRRRLISMFQSDGKGGFVRTKESIWNQIFEVGKSWGYSKETCRKKIEKRLSRMRKVFIQPNERDLLDNAYKDFVNHDKPFGMESVENMAKWRKAAIQRCNARMETANLGLQELNRTIAKLQKKQAKDIAWINKIEKTIAEKCELVAPIDHATKIFNIPGVKAK